MSDPEQNQAERRPQRRDAYDWIVLAIAVLAFVAAGAAAWFTWEQATVARDQTRRTLRAYVVADAELLLDHDRQGAFVEIAVENMGQTPVYDLFFVTWNSIIRQYESLPYKHNLTFDCKGEYAPQWVRRSRTFSKNHSSGLGVGSSSEPIKSLDELFQPLGSRVVAYGTICYRDIFREIHTVRVCFEWHSANYGAERCQWEDLGEQD